jgi:RNA polymerase sigma-70 factor (ECF subfamily)
MAAGGEPEGDDEVLRRLVDGDASAFDAIVRAHQDRVFRLALALLNGREDARDAAQEVFLRAFRGLHRWRFEARLSTWLYRLTLNVCREARRRRASEFWKRGRFLALVIPLAARRREAPVELPEAGLERLVEALPRRQREVVVLRVYEDLTIAEAAEVLGVPPGTVKSNYFRAIGALRRRLDAAPASALKATRP